ncbi:craniofacial development protein 1-like [Uloborus diversus]|uniref:craniofacial development protein 1-like n=1 Tax=Uloborus diversus TaxID=327109 RepID=UPI00240A093E|nr:craniofacial development protein 1-like [Uloborus diversus]
MASNLLIDDMKNDSSDSDDADYVPTGEHDSGDDSVPEDEIGTDEEALENSSKSKVRSKRKSKKKKETPVIEPEPELDVTDLTTESARKHADELYKKFLLDVENEKKPSNISVSTTSSGMNGFANSSDVAPVSQVNGKASAPEFFEFAGELISTSKGNIVSTESRIPVASAAGNLLVKKPDVKLANGEASSSSSPAASVVKRKGGLNAVLAIINKKKLSTLQKSHLDWKHFKMMNGLTEELACHNRGKDSYVEKKRFLERADLRTFEIEKNARLKKRK